LNTAAELTVKVPLLLLPMTASPVAVSVPVTVTAAAVTGAVAVTAALRLVAALMVTVWLLLVPNTVLPLTVKRCG